MRLMETAGLPSVKVITGMILVQMAQAAQAVYDRWEVDEDGLDPDLGGGGICQDIADVIQGILQHVGVDAIVMDSNGMVEQHVYVMAKFQEGVYEIDIHPSVYETGSGYSWQKIPDVEIQPSDISVSRWSKNPEDFDRLEDY